MKMDMSPRTPSVMSDAPTSPSLIAADKENAPQSLLLPSDGTWEEQKAEFDAFLRSGALDRAPNLTHILNYIGERYFSGQSDEVKEVTIAILALGRRVDFNPQDDAIVRVSMRMLRKRLSKYYADVGATRALRLSFPPGHYLPRFTRAGAESPELHETLSEPVAEEEGKDTTTISKNLPPFTRTLLGLTVAALILGIVGFLNWGLHRKTPPAKDSAPQPTSAGPIESSSASPIRILIGANQPWTDGDGNVWQPGDDLVLGGARFSDPSAPVAGTPTPVLFQSGRTGRMEIGIPVPPGNYELHLFFAEIMGRGEAVREMQFQINDETPQSLDVTDDAGGENQATMKIFSGLAPEKDGEVHIRFVSDNAFVNAIELFPTPSKLPLPMRISTAPNTIHDQNGVLWEEDKWFFGGRSKETSISPPLSDDLYRWMRLGNFRYVLPVAVGHYYTVRLYFSEPYFGTPADMTNYIPNENSVGKRVFDVYCNGQTLLKNFDILADAEINRQVVVKTFRHLQPTAAGKLVLSFVPVKNYPILNGIEVSSEN
jgi:Malectin domain